MRKILDHQLFPAILKDTRLSPSTVLVYEELRRAPIETVAAHIHRSVFGKHTVHRAVRQLTDTNWAFMTPGKTTRYPLVVPFMPLDVERTAVHELLQTRAHVAPVGEWLLKCILDLIVADLDYLDNARPEWLAPADGTGRLEVDRWYREAKVGIEFQGKQHYQRTSLTDEAGFGQQVMRDTVKAGLFMRQGVHFVEIPASELSFDYVTARLSGLLPLRPIPTDRPLYRTIANICQSYVNAMNKQ